MISIAYDSTTTVAAGAPTYFKKWHLNQQLVIDVEGLMPGQLVDFFSDGQDGTISTVVRLNENNQFVCDVPNILLTRDYNIRVSIDQVDVDGNIVAHHAKIFTIEDARKPEGYVYTETPVVRKDSYFHDKYPVFTKRFKTGTTAPGNAVVMSANDTVKNAAGGTTPIGVLLSKKNSGGLVQLTGEIKAYYTGSTTPTLGMTALVAAGSANNDGPHLRLPESSEVGRMCLITNINTTDKTMTVILL